jgi:hypothetical protein
MAFEPLVRDFILNGKNEYGHWVGGFAGYRPGGNDFSGFSPTSSSNQTV